MMRVVALISGGKDSCYNMLQCVSEGHQIVALANLKPQNKDEVDSYMFQTVGHHAIDVYAEAMGLPLYRRTISGFSKEIGRDYRPTVDDEVEDLYELLKMIMDEVKVEAVSVGAILSDYQRVRVENVCQRLNLTSLSYLWRREQETLLKEMIDCHIEAIIIKVAALGLEIDKHLGKTLEQIYPHMVKMNKTYGLNVCGEGGEYETFTLDCPLFVKKIVIDEMETVIHSDDAFAPVGYLNLHRLHLEDKPIMTNTAEYIMSLPLLRSSDLLCELLTDEEVKNLSDKTVSPSLTHCTNMKGTSEVTSKKTGNWSYVSGLLADLESSQSIEEATQTVMERLEKTVEQLECRMQDIVSVCLYVHSMENFAAINSVYKKFFGFNPPVRVCVQVCTPPNVVVMLDCCGCVTNQLESTMHVQSISHWAPANIGPYSQACKRGNKIYVAGQIAMVPATLHIVSGGITAQCRLSLRHTARILKAIQTECALDRVLVAVCYVTDTTLVVTAQEEWIRAVSNCTRSCEFETWRPLIQVVVVPALPKDALVEWQVSAYGGDQQLQEQFYEDTVESSAVSLRCRCTTEDQTVFACIASLECLKLVENADSYKECWRHLFECFDKLLTKTLFSWSDIPFLRVFYPASHFTYDYLHAAISECLTTMPGVDNAPLFNLIPVVQIGCDENRMVSVVCC
ncbi:diphthine--ammonia ligase-like [Gigantopelta aegis]|uniref:diphthine--ammonia ligase-like n=1 Tax=Gigantopelta aegis TaxID=1735272 RepID=UPI001B887D7E|nr:diphthine--ammonia ligase-like [Gigantopelta aegis]